MIKKGSKPIIETHPHLTKYFLNKDDVYQYSYASHKKVDFLCPVCKRIIKNKSIASITSSGFQCPCCSDGISYPNKFLINLFAQLNTYLDTEYHPDWIKPKKYRYDGFFILDDKKYIVEMDGGLGHGKRVYKNSKLTSKESLERDMIKDNLAKANDHIVIRIDCSVSSKDYIANNIKNSLLGNLFDMDGIDWDLVDKNSQKSLLVEVCDIYNNGENDPRNISKKINIGYSTVLNYLHMGTKLGLCEYDVLYMRKQNCHSNDGSYKERSVYCLTTKEKFESTMSASRKYKITNSNISACCLGKRNYAGIHPTNYLPLVWMYYEEYCTLTNDEIQKRLDIKLSTGMCWPVICLSTNKIFKSFAQASQYYNLSTPHMIKQCCINQREYYGEFDGINLTWSYYTL